MNDQTAIDALYACAAVCDYCAAACLNEDDVNSLTPCVGLDMDCAEICRTTATLLARGSEHGEHMLKECIEVCEKCAAECDKHAAHMDHCRRCAEACRKCVAVCRELEHA